MRLLGAAAVLLALGSTATAQLLRPPILGARSAVVMDEDTGRILWAKNPDTLRYPASTTKILTCLLLLENTDPSDVIRAPNDVTRITGSSLRMKPGETISARDMAYALMLRSANDGAYATAVHVGGSVQGFSNMMNARIERIGLNNSKFQNPHGLHHSRHYTTAREMAMIAREAMKNPEFREIVDTDRVTVSRSINTADSVIENRNVFLERDPSNHGIKTGYTNPAGRCFVGAGERDGLRLITVVFKCDDWKKDHAALTEWAFSSFEPRTLYAPGQPIGEIAVDGGVQETVKVAPSEAVTAVVPKRWQPQDGDLQFDVRLLDAPISKGRKIGTARLSIPNSGGQIMIPVVAADRVDRKKALWEYALTPWGGGGILGLGMVSVWALRRKPKKRRRRGRVVIPAGRTR